MKKYNDTDFVRLSTSLRASLGTLSHAQRVQKAVDGATSVAALTAAMRSIMTQDAAAPEGAALDELCDLYFAHAVDAVRKNAPEPGMYDSLLYKFDAANVKLALKSAFRGVECPAMFPYGTVDERTVLEAAEKRDFSAFPAELAEGCEQAAAAWSETRDAMAVDVLIDRGCFAAAARSAKESGVPLLPELVALDADAANATAFARIAALDLAPEAKRELFSRAFVPGGKLAEAKFPRSEMTFDALADALGGTYVGADVRRAAESADRTAALESAFRRRRTALCDGVRFVPFGGEVPAAYLVEREAEVRAFALAAAYMRRGAGAAEIRTALS